MNAEKIPTQKEAPRFFDEQRIEELRDVFQELNNAFIGRKSEEEKQLAIDKTKLRIIGVMPVLDGAEAESARRVLDELRQELVKRVMDASRDTSGTGLQDMAMLQPIIKILQPSDWVKRKSSGIESPEEDPGKVMSVFFNEYSKQGVPEGVGRDFAKKQLERVIDRMFSDKDKEGLNDIYRKLHVMNPVEPENKSAPDSAMKDILDLQSKIESAIKMIEGGSTKQGVVIAMEEAKNTRKEKLHRREEAVKARDQAEIEKTRKEIAGIGNGR